MKTIFDKQISQELIERIHTLSQSDRAQWGKMSAYQMLKHCSMNEELFLKKKIYPRLFVGRLFGKMALNGMMKNEAPLKKNNPTHPDMKIKGSGDFEAQRKEWLGLLRQYENFETGDFVHPFFGRMTREQIGRAVYKHTDHHLRQFGK